MWNRGLNQESGFVLFYEDLIKRVHFFLHVRG